MGICKHGRLACEKCRLCVLEQALLYVQNEVAGWDRCESGHCRFCKIINTIEEALCDEEE